MFLHAALTPPSEVLEAVGLAVQAAQPPDVPVPQPPPPRRGAFERLSGRHVQVAEPRTEPVSVFELVPANRLCLSIAGFGSVTMGDAIRVAETLKEEAEQWATPTVHVAGAALHEASGRRSIVLTLDGEVAELQSVARAVTQCVQRRGFRFDRRVFQPHLEVATIAAAATPSQVMSFLNALEGFQGPPWAIDHLSLLKRSFDTAAIDSMEYLRIPLGRH